MSEASTTTELPHEKLFASFRAWADANLGQCPEARTMVLVVDWKVGSDWFPPGLLHARQGTPAGVAALGSSRQLARALVQSVGAVAARIDVYPEVAPSPSNSPPTSSGP
jgi:hypothetical protein